LLHAIDDKDWLEEGNPRPVRAKRSRFSGGLRIILPQEHLSVPFSHGVVAMRLMLSLGVTTGEFEILSGKQVT
jgi:hypothetical protein